MLLLLLLLLLLLPLLVLQIVEILNVCICVCAYGGEGEKFPALKFFRFALFFVTRGISRGRGRGKGRRYVSNNIVGLAPTLSSNDQRSFQLIQ